MRGFGSAKLRNGCTANPGPLDFATRKLTREGDGLFPLDSKMTLY